MRYASFRSEASCSCVHIDVQELATLIKSGAKASTDYAIVDVRDDDRIGGHIVESHHQPSLTFIDNVQGLLEKMKNVPKVVFHCALSQERFDSLQ